MPAVVHEARVGTVGSRPTPSALELLQAGRGRDRIEPLLQQHATALIVTVDASAHCLARNGIARIARPPHGCCRPTRSRLLLLRLCLLLLLRLLHLLRLPLRLLLRPLLGGGATQECDHLSAEVLHRLVGGMAAHHALDRLRHAHTVKLAVRFAQAAQPYLTKAVEGQVAGAG